LKGREGEKSCPDYNNKAVESPLRFGNLAGTELEVTPDGLRQRINEHPGSIVIVPIMSTRVLANFCDEYYAPFGIFVQCVVKPRDISRKSLKIMIGDDEG